MDCSMRMLIVRQCLRHSARISEMSTISNAVHTLTADGDARIHVGNNIYRTEDRCLADLRSADPRDDKTRIEQTKGGLLEDSYCWILNNADFQQWRNDEQSRLLWIKGDPGKGKTMLLCDIINELKKETTNLLSYSFCQGTDLRINNATAVLRGLIYLIVAQQPSLIPHVRKKYDHAGKGLFEDVNVWVALAEIFANILQDLNLKSTFLIISAAISIYIRHKVDQLAQLKRYNDKTQDAVQHYLSSNANDTFLWVALAG
ncbi:beta transducin-like protein HET-D2Y [Ilyonectria robusta]